MRTHRHALGLGLLLALLLILVPIAAGAGDAPAGASGGPDPEFGSVWHDGKAELDGYHWSGTRYGQPRQGQSVMIFVTEPMSKSQRVKVDDPSKNPSDVVDVLKLNLVRDFQTGIYDYNTMTSIFARTADFTPLKVSFTSAEWCGNVYDEMRVDPGKIQEEYRSYFEGESGNTELENPADGVLGDALFILLRGLRGDYLPPGGKKTVPFLAGVFHRRLLHQPSTWTRAEIERLPDLATVQVPAGTFSAMTYVVRTQDGREGRFEVEAAYPHRIVSWSWKPTDAEPPTESTPGQGRWPAGMERGELAGSARLEYWKLHGNGDETYLQQLGLRPLPE